MSANAVERPQESNGAPFRHDPYHGLGHLVGLSQPGASLDTTLDDAERFLGCVPGGRLRRLVFMCAALAMMQRVRDERGTPLLVAKGGLILQSLLGSSSRPTRDLDAVLHVEPEPFLDQLRLALAEPWGAIHAHIERVSIHRSEPVPFDALEISLSLEANGCRPEPLPVDISFGVQSDTDALLYQAPNLSSVGLPVPEGLWGLDPARMIAEKIVTCCEPHDPDGLFGVRPARPNKHGKHLVDLIALIQARGNEKLFMREVASKTKRLLSALEALRGERGFLPYARPLRVQAHDHWRGEYLCACLESGLRLPMNKAVEQVNAWLENVDRICLR